MTSSVDHTPLINRPIPHPDANQDHERIQDLISEISIGDPRNIVPTLTSLDFDRIDARLHLQAAQSGNSKKAWIFTALTVIAIAVFLGVALSIGKEKGEVLGICGVGGSAIFLGFPALYYHHERVEERDVIELMNVMRRERNGQ
jgi:hypothetical protein